MRVCLCWGPHAFSAPVFVSASVGVCVCKCVCAPYRLLLICGLFIPVDSKGVRAERIHQSSGGGGKGGVKIDGLGRIQMCLFTPDAFRACLHGNIKEEGLVGTSE